MTVSTDALLQQIHDELDVGVCAFDADWRLLSANTAGRKLENDLHYDDGRLERLGTFTTDELSAAEEPLRLVLDGPPPLVLEVTVRSVHNGPAAWLIFARDITSEQERFVAARDQERLAAMGQLAAGIAHDFNNILTAMIGYAEVLLITGKFSADVEEKLEVIITSGQRAAQLVRQILDFSRQRSVYQKTIDLVPLITEAYDLLRQGIPENIHTELRHEETSLLARANASQVQEVVANLIVNARDAVGPGARIDVRTGLLNLSEGQPIPVSGPTTEPAPVGGNWACVSVSDTGSGIPEDVLSRIFEPFFTTKAESGGTGLGLSQVYGIVKQHDGFVDVESVSGEGTTFRIYLPLAEASEEEEGSESQAYVRGNGETVLVVEDEEQVLTSVEMMLDTLGYTTVTARNGKEALDLIADREGAVDCVLSDIVMPEMDGVELFRTLRRTYPHVPVVLMTGHTVEDKESLQQQTAGFLTKPPSLSELSVALSGALVIRDP